MKLLVTGGAGFIGSNFIRYILEQYPSCHVINFDKLTYAGNLENLKDVEDNGHYRFIKGDICDRELVNEIAGEADVIINFAAETHVDRSIENPYAFIDTDIRGVITLIEAAKEAGHERFIHISTDEVYGDYNEGGFAKEDAPLRPSSPYAASKAGGDLQVLAAIRTYGFPGIITRCTNNYGPYQYPEKMIPLFITNALERKELPLYGKGDQIRDWLYVYDHCTAIDTVLHKGARGEIYNISAGQDPEVTNKELTYKIVEQTGISEDLIKPVQDRPGHDRRYAVDSSKIRELGWEPSVNFEQGLQQTIDWYKAHEDWWKRIKSGEYAQWYKQQYER